jgi:hypothetical protein
MSWELHDPDEGSKNYWPILFALVLLTLCLLTVLA